MYHIVNDIASLNTTSLDNLAQQCFLNRPHIFKHEGFKSLWDTKNIAKIHRRYSWDVHGWCSDKKEGIFLIVDPFKEKKSTLDPSSRASAAWSKPL